MLKTIAKITILLALIIFFVLVLSGVLWEIALFRALISYLVLMIVFYLSILLLNIMKPRNPSSGENAENPTNS